MDFKLQIVFILSAFAFLESQQLLTQVMPLRRRTKAWHQRTRINLKSPTAAPQSGPSLKHEVSLGNLNLAPGQAKIIQQTLVVRRRPSKSTPKPRRMNNFGSHPLPSQASGQGPRRPSPGGQQQRGAGNHGSPHRGLYLLSHLPKHATVHTQPSGGGQKVASLRLPVIDLSPASHGTSHRSNKQHGTNSNHQPGRGHTFSLHGNQNSNHGGFSHGNQNSNQGHGVGPIGGAGHLESSMNHPGSGAPLMGAGGSLLGSALSAADVARHLLAGNPDIIIIPDLAPGHTATDIPGFSYTSPTALPGSNNAHSFNGQNSHSNHNSQHTQSGAGHNVNIRVSAHPNRSGDSSVNMRSSVRVQSEAAVEPGEDPPELP